MRFFVAMVLLAIGIYVIADDCPQGLCVDTETCCDAQPPGLYSCCPEQNAVCCSDGLHCCPANTVCNLQEGTCDPTKKLIPTTTLVFRNPPSAITLQVASKVEVVYCPGGEYYCPDRNTCCLLSSGRYGCCPLPSAVCCSDGVHCCPSHTYCTSGMCHRGSSRFAALFKRPAFPMN